MSQSHFGEAAARSLVQSYQGEAIARQREHVFKALAPRPGEHVVDVGCGPGFMTAMLADAVGADGSVFAFDASDAMIELARERLGERPGVRLATGDVTAIDAPDNQFDVGACMQVLLYVEEVEVALREIFRVLRPGGRVAFIETDWTTALVVPGDREVTRQVFAAWDASVASPALPARLPSLLRACGFDIPTVDAIPIVDTAHEPDGFAANTLSRCARLAIKEGFADGDSVAEWQAGIKAAVAEGSYLFCANRYLFLATKP